MSMTENEAAIARNQQLTSELRRAGTLVNALFVLIILGLVVVLVVVSSSSAAQNSDLRDDADAADVELRCRSKFVNEQAEAQANLSIEDAHNDSLTSRALARIARGEDYSELTDQLDASADRLEALSKVLEKKTRLRSESVDACQEG